MACHHLLLARVHLPRDDEAVKWRAEVHRQQLLHRRRHDLLVVRLQPRDPDAEGTAVKGALLARRLDLEKLLYRLYTWKQWRARGILFVVLFASLSAADAQE